MSVSAITSGRDAAAATQRAPRNRALAAFLITSVALFMVTLDNLVVTTAAN
jgi:hypothetical protein